MSERGRKVYLMRNGSELKSTSLWDMRKRFLGWKSVIELRPDKKNKKEENLILLDYLHESGRRGGRDIALYYC